ncbi:GNAT family N-acetyltransferase [candidate division KSB1 bacterium]|nr:GNAT family N-acetyltransferase [candidate division KSB1 bacterium]MBL7093551.1 GNAT family N-acetyltransferase [candidate division KSB1 bacterium]
MNVDKSKIKIHRVNKNEIDTMAQHRINYLTELQGEREKKYKNQLRKELSGFFFKSISEGSFIAIVAKIEDQVIGYGGMIIKQIPGDFNKSFYLECEILNMYTIPEARRQGVASLVLKQLLQIAKEKGISKVALHTSKDGEKLYRSFGFSNPEYPFLELLIKS